MSSEAATANAIQLNGISKCYRLYAQPQDRLKQMLLRGRKKYFSEFWALHSVSFAVPQGGCVGIVGRNGAGKSTLLQIITGIVAPTAGSINVIGRVAALLELGTGFNPEFTGKENVFLNGSILGLTQDELREKYDDIIEFADIGNFIHQPVKTYSSGMMVRLAFAVAIHVDPDILIVDEALSVGDAKFQAKCFRKFQEFREKKKTILFVTHSTEQVIRHCDSVILMEGGKVLAQGEPREVANKYLSLLFDTNPLEKNEQLEDANSTPSLADAVSDTTGAHGKNEMQCFLDDVSGQDRVSSRPGYNSAEYRWGNAEAKIIDYILSNEKHWHINHFSSTDKISINVKIKFERDVLAPIYGLTLKTPDGVTIYGTNSRDLNPGDSFKARCAGEVANVCFTLDSRLTSGHYFISLGIVEEGSDDVQPLDRRYDVIEIYITNEKKIYGIADLNMTFSQQK